MFGQQLDDLGVLRTMGAHLDQQPFQQFETPTIQRARRDHPFVRPHVEPMNRVLAVGPLVDEQPFEQFDLHAFQRPRLDQPVVRTDIHPVERERRIARSEMRGLCSHRFIVAGEDTDRLRWLCRTLPLDRRVHLVQQLRPVGDLIVLGEILIGVLARVAVQGHVQRDQPRAVQIAVLGHGLRG